MKVELDGGEAIDLGTTETAPTIGITDYSRRVTDDYGVTTVVRRGFARRMSVRLALPFSTVDTVQRRLAELRATAALWIADDRFDSLKVRGFYKDFDIDLGVPPLSYCTLTVDGLVESELAEDPGTDPAPPGRTSSLRLLQPVPVTAAVLTGSTVAEADHPEWAAGTSYASGARVIKAATHRIYESVAAANVGNDPAGPSGKWLDVGPTNRWAMFDQALGTLTQADTAFAVVIAPGAVNALALLDVTAAAARVQTTGFDRTVAVGAGPVTFLDLPGGDDPITVTVAGTGAVSVGTLLVGKLVALGVTGSSPTAGIADYSRKDVDDFGEVTVVERGWAKRMSARALIRTDAIDVVANRIAAVRAMPSLWIGEEGVDSLTIYGFFKDFSIEVAENVSVLSLSVEGLSTAAPPASGGLLGTVAWPDITDPAGTKPADNATVGAPTGTNVAGVPAENVVNRIVSLEAVSGGGEAGEVLAALEDLQGQIADAGTLIAGITAQTRDGAPNLLPNGDFRNGLSGWTTTGSGWEVISGFSIGPFVQNSGGVVGNLIYRDVPVTAGTSYSLSAEMDPDTGGDLEIHGEWLTSAGSHIADTASIATDAWVRSAIVAVAAPTGAAKIRIYARRTSNSGIVRATRIQFQAGEATEWNSAASDYEVTTRLTTEEATRQGQTAALATRASNLEAQVAGTAGSGLKALITTNATTAANDNAAVAANVVNITARLRQGSPNLLANSDFQQGLSGWTVDGSGWTIVTGYAVGPFAQNSGTVGDFLRQDVPAQAGTSYSLSAEMDPDAANAIEVYLDWLNGSGGVIANAGLIRADGWQRAASGLLTAPIGTVTARVRIRQATAGVTGRATRVQLQEGAFTDYRPDASLGLVAAHIATEETARASADVAIAARTTIVEAQLAGTTASGLKASITTNATTAADATNAVATDVTRVTARIRQGSPNLLANSDFHSGLESWTRSSGWEVIGGFAIGAFAQRGGAAVGDYLYQDVAVQAGTSYSLSAEAEPSGGGAGAWYVQWFNSDRSSYLGAASSFSPTAWSSGRGAVGPFTAPTGAAWARVTYACTAAGTLRTTRAQLQEGSATDYRADQSLGLLAAQVTQQAGVLADHSGKLVAWLENVASVPGATAAVVLKASTGSGGSTSNASFLAHSLFFFVKGADPGTAQLAMDITSVGGVPQLNFYGNIAAQRVVTSDNLDYGATGNASVFYQSPYNENSSTDFTGVIGLGIDVTEGAPVRGDWNAWIQTITGTPNYARFRVVRRYVNGVLDNTPIWGGADGIPIFVPAGGMPIASFFYDSVPAGTGVQYDVQVKVVSGVTLREYGRVMEVREMVRDRFSQFNVVSPAGEGPGAGDAGGGNINGDTSGDGDGVTGSTPSTGNAGRGGIRGRTAEP